MKAPKMSDFFLGEYTVEVDGEKQKRYDYNWDAYYAAQNKYEEYCKNTHRRRITTLCNAYGISRVDIDFSGGNDQGGADGFTFYDRDGNVIDSAERNFEYTYTHRRNEETGKFEEYKLTDEEEEINNLLDALEEPLNRKWGSWAGDFYASGTLKYDFTAPLDKPFWTMDYDEQSGYDHYTEQGV